MKIKVIDKGYKRLPERAHYNDSGADVFALKDIEILPGQVVKAGLGFGLELPDGYDAVINCKSGLSARGVWIANAPIDAGYHDEIHAILLNVTNEPVQLNAGDKIGQLVIRPVDYTDFVVDLGAERGTGAFGSTGR